MSMASDIRLPEQESRDGTRSMKSMREIEGMDPEYDICDRSDEASSINGGCNGNGVIAVKSILTDEAMLCKVIDCPRNPFMLRKVQSEVEQWIAVRREYTSLMQGRFMPGPMMQDHGGPIQFSGDYAWDHATETMRIYIKSQGDGINLELYLSQHRFRAQSVHPAVALICATNLAGALTSCHALGIVHQDLTPRNLIVDIPPYHHTTLGDRTKAEVLNNERDGSRYKKITKFDLALIGCWMLDFGIGRFSQSNVHPKPISNGNSLISSLGSSVDGYIAPEAWLNGGNLTPASNVYSLGCIIHALFTNKTPRFIDGEATPRKPQIMQEYQPELWDIIQQCLNTDPDRRPTSRTVFDLLYEQIDKHRKIGLWVDETPEDPQLATEALEGPRPGNEYFFQVLQDHERYNDHASLKIAQKLRERTGKCWDRRSLRYGTEIIGITHLHVAIREERYLTALWLLHIIHTQVFTSDSDAQRHKNREAVNKVLLYNPAVVHPIHIIASKPHTNVPEAMRVLKQVEDVLPGSILLQRADNGRMALHEAVSAWNVPFITYILGLAPSTAVLLDRDEKTAWECRDPVRMQKSEHLLEPREMELLQGRTRRPTVESKTKKPFDPERGFISRSYQMWKAMS